MHGLKRKNFQGPRGKNGKRLEKIQESDIEGNARKSYKERATRSDSSGNDFIAKVVGCEAVPLFNRHLQSTI